MTAHVSVSAPRGERSIIRFGATLRADPDARFRLYRLEPVKAPDGRITGKAHVVLEGAVPRDGRLLLAAPTVEAGALYLVLARGRGIAGAIASDRVKLRAPFSLKIDASPAAAPAPQPEPLRIRCTPLEAGVRQALAR